MEGFTEKLNKFDKGEQVKEIIETLEQTILWFTDNNRGSSRTYAKSKIEWELRKALAKARGLQLL